jgi:hypothetical protein
MDFSLTKKKKKKKKDLDEDLEGGKAQRAEEAENGTYLLNCISNIASLIFNACVLD